jgi:dihydrofolate reductase
MSSTVLYMSMSLDGFIAGPNERPDNGLGDGGERLHEWVFPGAEGGDFEAAVARLTGVNRQVYDEFMSTGAVIAGRGTFEPAEGWGGDHHDGVPIYILSRHPKPAWAADWANVHYVSDLAAAVRDAKAASLMASARTSASSNAHESFRAKAASPTSTTASAADRVPVDVVAGLVPAAAGNQVRNQRKRGGLAASPADDRRTRTTCAR